VKGPGLIFRWLLLPAIIYLLGQFLEGPPYRVIVRGLPFILTSFVLSGFAAHNLHQKFRLPILISIVQGALIPAGFVLVIQRYYNGGMNHDYATVAILFTLAMGINGIIYLWSLFDWKNWKTGRCPAQIGHYEIKLCTLCDDGTTGRLKYHDKGEESPPEAIFLDGFSQNQCIDLAPYWAEVLDEHIEEFQTDITVKETIIKFGETMQLVDHYRLQIVVSYQH
jgi:hypothetical protein